MSTSDSETHKVRGDGEIVYTLLISVQFIQFHQIHYKSKRPIGYRTSHSAIYVQILILKIQITK
jgi:hypothetical protein